MKKVKRKTHEVAKSYLKRWKSNNNKIWYFDIKKQKIKESSLQAKFAIKDYLYVPLVNNLRDDSTEEWFANAENELARFISKIDKPKFMTPLKREKIFLIILALTGLCHRSSYSLLTIQNAMQLDPNLENILGVKLDTDNDYHNFAVENMINIITRQAKHFCEGSISIRHGFTKDLLICDQPGFDMTTRGDQMNAIPLGPNALLVMDAKGSPPALFEGIKISKATSNSIVQSFNEITINRARKWVVATNKEQLESIAHKLTKEKVSERKLTDKLNFIEITDEQQKNGWRLKGKKHK